MILDTQFNRRINRWCDIMHGAKRIIKIKVSAILFYNE